MKVDELKFIRAIVDVDDLFFPVDQVPFVIQRHPDVVSDILLEIIALCDPSISEQEEEDGDASCEFHATR